MKPICKTSLRPERCTIVRLALLLEISPGLERMTESFEERCICRSRSRREVWFGSCGGCGGVWYGLSLVVLKNKGISGSGLDTSNVERRWRGVLQAILMRNTGDHCEQLITTSVTKHNCRQFDDNEHVTTSGMQLYQGRRHWHRQSFVHFISQVQCLGPIHRPGNVGADRRTSAHGAYRSRSLGSLLCERNGAAISLLSRSLSASRSRGRRGGNSV